jgi:lipopolysaccharide export system protein LptA
MTTRLLALSILCVALAGSGGAHAATRTKPVAPAAAAAAPAAGGQASASVPGSQPISITGDHFTIDDQKHQAVFLGNVVTLQGDLTVHSDTVVANYGQGGSSNITTVQAKGNVVLTTADQTATGDVANFDPKNHTMVMTGNVVVTNKTGRVQASQLTVDLRTHKSVFSSDTGRVTGVFNSE